MSIRCNKCNKELTKDEIALYKKLINRNANSYLCKTCLAVQIDVESEILDKKIGEFKKMGCSLFMGGDE